MVFPSTGMDTPKRRKRLKMSTGSSGSEDQKDLSSRKDSSSAKHSTPTLDSPSDREYDGDSPLRTPVRNVYRRIEADNEESPGIELMSYLKHSSSPTVVWDFARPKQSQSIMEAASRIHKELKEHQAKRLQHKSPTYCRDRPLLCSENEEENVLKAVERYRNSFNNLNTEILAMLQKSDSSDEESSTERVARKRKSSSISRERLRSISRVGGSSTARRIVPASKAETTTPLKPRIKETVTINNNNSDLNDLFNDSFDDIMLSQSQIIESKVSKTCTIPPEKDQSQMSSQVVDELNDGNDDLFSGILCDF